MRDCDWKKVAGLFVGTRKGEAAGKPEFIFDYLLVTFYLDGYCHSHCIISLMCACMQPTHNTLHQDVKAIRNLQMNQCALLSKDGRVLGDDSMSCRSYQPVKNFINVYKKEESEKILK